MITSAPNIKLKDIQPKFIITINDGKIIKMEEFRKLEKEERYIWNLPKKNCKHCYGRGYMGIDFKTQWKVPCKCVFRDKPTIDEMLLQQVKGELPCPTPKN